MNVLQTGAQAGVLESSTGLWVALEDMCAQVFTTSSPGPRDCCFTICCNVLYEAEWLEHIISI